MHEVSAAEGARGLPGEAPFDVILLSGSVAEVPPALLAQLKVGGRLAAVVGELPMMRARLFKRAGDAAWSDIDLFDTVAPRLRGLRRADALPLLDALPPARRRSLSPATAVPARARRRSSHGGRGRPPPPL